jgi:hypothetical protein
MIFSLKKAILLRIILGAIAALSLGLAANSAVRLASAQTQPASIRVGVVVQAPGTGVSQQCVTLNTDHATGLDALKATQLDMDAQVGPLGASICRLKNVGCTTPAQDCFCQCQGGQCNYWAYYHIIDGGWSYSQLGLSNVALHNGDVEGWLWSESSNMTPAGALPNTSFDTICSQPVSASLSAGAVSPTQPTILTSLGYLLFGVAIAAIFGVILWRRTRPSH